MILSLLLPFSLPVFPSFNSRPRPILFEIEPRTVELKVKIAVNKKMPLFLFFVVVVSGIVVGCTL